MNQSILEFNLRVIENELKSIKKQCETIGNLFDFNYTVTLELDRIKVSIAGIAQAIKHLRELEVK